MSIGRGRELVGQKTDCTGGGRSDHDIPPVRRRQSRHQIPHGFASNQRIV